MKRGPLILITALAAAATSHAYGQDSEQTPAPTQTSALDGLDARQAVRQGNRHLLADDAPAALEAYRHARTLAPDAREIDFNNGLAQYSLGDFEEARGSFENAATSKSDALVDDAIYSVGTTYHAEALKSQENPQQAVAQLEEAMRRYQTVLEHQPDHASARDANFKAASMWRSLKQQMQQQQQPQDGDDENKDKDDSEQDQDQDKNQDQEQQQDQDQQQDENEDSDQQQQQQDQEQSKSGEQKDEKQHGAQAEQDQQESREQAERKLRELMQALRDRKKRRPEKTEPVKLIRVDKDW